MARCGHRNQTEMAYTKAPQRSINKFQVTNCMCTPGSELEHDMTLAGPQHTKAVNGYN